MKKDIRQLTLAEMEAFLVAEGEKAFRAKQVYEWLWKKAARSFAEMTNLSKGLRSKLEEHFWLRPLHIAEAQKSHDRTIKYAFELHDGYQVEGVLIPADKRMTACVSSQVGCSLSCKFCATGYMKRERNLEAGEIYDQVVRLDEEAQKHYQTPLSNIVFMGMGEPLLNYKAVVESIHHLTSPEGLHMSPKRITVSTAGIAKMIRKLGEDQVRFNLALSLHAANDQKRNKIMPINETNSLSALGEALAFFYQQTKNRVTFEYIVFKDFNDRLEDAQELYAFSKRVPAKINIIEYNPIQEANFQNTQEDRLSAFAHYLEEKGLTVNVRRSRGKDIDAACGQLAIKKQKPSPVGEGT